MAKHEIEIKSLLGTKEKADAFKEKIKNKGALLASKHSQLNHYFILNDQEKLENVLVGITDEEQESKLKEILEKGSNFSVRTRDADGKVLIVVKASVDDTTSENGVRRMEFEEVVNLTLDEVDQLLIKNGCEYQAKWSREREEYKLGDFNICLDKNAGYGYLAEVERVVEEESDLDEVQKSIVDLMDELDMEELSQERLEKMFSFYNENWRDYYGTEKVFVIE